MAHNYLYECGHIVDDVDINGMEMPSDSDSVNPYDNTRRKY